ncbi:MAG: beta-ketoacyl-ACP synthase II [Actinomycetota bacterium]|jgi:3-oxoacyl-[acyl-carrier-protein] synthase II|nr:beta-ketoacyl-ACP synthase II [Actinomycetota bacterium]
MQLETGDPSAGAGRRVVVTGLGAITCCGVGADALWQGLVAPSAVGERRATDFVPEDFFGPKEVRRVDRFAQFSVAAAEMAIGQAGDLRADPGRCGVVFGTGVGGFETLATQVQVYLEKGPRRVSPFFVPMMMPNAGAATISMRAGWRGPSETITTACAAGTHSVGAAARLVATGRCDVAVGGGGEASLHPVAVAAFGNMTALSTSGVSRPFDARRDGFVIAEGAAALVLEERDRALARGARVFAEIAGFASTADAYHITAPLPDGGGAMACMEQAIADAGLQPAEIAHVNAHGTSTPLNDLAEARAIEKVFDGSGPIVTSNKGVTGHALGAAGAIEAVASVLSITHGLIPATYGCEELDPEIHLDVVQGAPRAWTPGPVLSNSFGFGGHNGCLVLLPPS